jgi:hypothetical protein
MQGLKQARRAPARWAFLKFNIGLMGKIRLRRKTGPSSRNDIARWAAVPPVRAWSQTLTIRSRVEGSVASRTSSQE